MIRREKREAAQFCRPGDPATGPDKFPQGRRLTNGWTLCFLPVKYITSLTGRKQKFVKIFTEQQLPMR
jgi:hypothetical protein